MGISKSVRAGDVKGQHHQFSGGVESTFYKATGTRSTGDMHLFDSGGKIGVAAQPVKTGHAIAGHVIQCQARTGGLAR